MVQPFRISGFTYLLASPLLVNFICAAFQSSSPSTRAAITPITIHSVNGPAIEKFEHDGAPPLQARIQSRWCPGDRVRNSGGSLYSFIRDDGSSRTFAA